MNDVVLAFEHVSKHYERAGRPGRDALRDVSFQIARGRVVALVGRSGSGKSTLLHLAAGIDVPSSGSVRLDGLELQGLGDRQRTLLRRQRVGILYQFFHLLPHLSVFENIALPEWINGNSTAGVRQRAVQLLDRVGLADRADDNVRKLSGGEMQRVALCRALVRRPALLLADEPTGNLDDDNSQRVMDLTLRLTREENGTLVYVTHSRELARLADETWELHSGSLERS